MLRTYFIPLGKWGWVPRKYYYQVATQSTPRPDWANNWTNETKIFSTHACTDLSTHIRTIIKHSQCQIHDLDPDQSVQSVTARRKSLLFIVA